MWPTRSCPTPFECYFPSIMLLAQHDERRRHRYGEKIMTVELNPRRNRDGRQGPLRLLRWTTAGSFIALAPCQAQSAMSESDMSSPPPAAAADVRSMDAIMHAYYDVLSGPAGNRDWNRFYSLFVPGGRLIETDRPAADSTPRTVVLTPQGFAQQVGP